jgi:hypothetical protein
MPFIDTPQAPPSAYQSIENHETKYAESKLSGLPLAA